jgi:hypothetical protein
MDNLQTQFKSIKQQLEAITYQLDELLENPIFINTIHGEQEMQLELTLELLDSIITKFTPVDVNIDEYASYRQDDLSDAS